LTENGKREMENYFLMDRVSLCKMKRIVEIHSGAGGITM
jgi:hypothetical protein